MPTKINIENGINFLNVLDDFIQREMDYTAQESPKKVLEFFINKHIPIYRYKNLNTHNAVSGEYKGYSWLLSTISIKETSLPPGILQADTIEHINVSYLEPQKDFYNETFFTSLVKQTLISYFDKSHLTRKYGGYKKLYNGLENNDKRIPALVDFGQIIIDKSFSEKDLSNYIPKNLPEKIEVQGMLEQDNLDQSDL